jgi:hypothetical protein
MNIFGISAFSHDSGACHPRRPDRGRIAGRARHAEEARLPLLSNTVSRKAGSPSRAAAASRSKTSRSSSSSVRSFFHTMPVDPPPKVKIHRDVMDGDWLSVRASSDPPWAIGHQHVDLFGSSEDFLFAEVFGRGEMLFARKLSHDDFDVVSASSSP